MTDALNPVLFNALRGKFGDVMIANPGVHGVVVHSKVNTRDYVEVSGGEYYRVHCPKCGDCNHHLWISYLFGTTDDRTGKKLFHLATCYRCQGTGWDSDLMQDLLPTFSKARYQVPCDIVEQFPDLKPVSMPKGTYTSLDKLPGTHPAIAYLTARGYSITEINQSYRWLYYHDSPDAFLVRRLFIPVFDEIDDKLQLVGYQTRVIPGLSLCEEPKYWTKPGFPRSRVLYNLHNARHHRLIVITEGVTDVARVGPHAISLLGKSLSIAQLRILLKKCADKRIAVMLDSDAYPAAQAITSMLSSGCVEGSHIKDGVFAVPLPGGDPGDYSREKLHSMVLAAEREYEENKRKSNDKRMPADC